MKSFYTNLTIVLFACFTTNSFKLWAQDSQLIERIPFESHVQLSDAIIEGEVISKSAFWDDSQKIIYTSNIIKVYKVFKGSASSTIEILTPGGVLDMQAMMVSHSLELKQGDIGVFMLKEEEGESALAKTSNISQIYSSFGNIQGFFKYDLQSNKAVNIFSSIDNITDTFYSKLETITGDTFAVTETFDIKNKVETYNKTSNTSFAKSVSVAPAITSFSTTNNSAGTKSVLTINGAGFGSTKGKVAFSNANYGGALHTETLDNQVLTWSDNQITVEIPDEAGTGTFLVKTSSNISVQSSSNVIIDYAQINLSYDVGSGEEDFRTQLIDLNGVGGISWTINEDFNVSDAMAPFQRAMYTWSCESGMNWETGSTTTSSTLDPYDGVNLVTFGSLGMGTLGYTFSSYSACYQDGEIKWYVTDVDIVFNGDINWNYTTNPPQSSQIDFESVAVHELGHAHQLGHVIDTDIIMHYSLSSGEMLRQLSPEDLMGSSNIQDRNVNDAICSQSVMTNSSCYASSLSNEENSFNDNIAIYPNPAKDHLSIKNTTGFNIEKVTIYNMVGKQVYHAFDRNINNYQSLNINLANFSKGMYLVKLDAEFGTATKKLIVQ